MNVLVYHDKKETEFEANQTKDPESQYEDNKAYLEAPNLAALGDKNPLKFSRTEPGKTQDISHPHNV
ncbi:hypothetical protein PROFUN_06248 [Planoprotostelium fungivorum]|uniref:Uncharacterized protein n=1 Tax=Planoprotostelium fungivorum TaxID=1890364 RepID=A0A2P6NE51_9EUKA|nr:hypothetical protein PROFUN_06248 [Planoprotostelium fungivorum]